MPGAQFLAPAFGLRLSFLPLWGRRGRNNGLVLASVETADYMKFSRQNAAGISNHPDRGACSL